MKRRTFLQVTAVSAVLAQVRADNAAPKQPKLHFDDSGKFRIAQFTDTHFVAEKEACQESVKLIEETLDAEKPQLAVFTGDIVTRSKDTKAGWDAVLKPCIDRQIPHAVMLGNHDHEGASLNRKQIVEYTSSLPFAATKLGPADVYGHSNYVLEIYEGDKPANLIYCLDSNAYNNLNKSTRLTGYDWFHQSQIDWVRKESTQYTQKNGGKPLPALAFFHIPLNEFGEMIHFKAVLNEKGEIVKTKGKNVIAGKRFEQECPGALNLGMFAAFQEGGDVMGVFVGHDHVNDYVALYNDIALGFGRWSGVKASTYGWQHFTHGSRLFELTSPNTDRTFRTWVRQRGGEKLDDITVPKDLTAK